MTIKTFRIFLGLFAVFNLNLVLFISDVRADYEPPHGGSPAGGRSTSSGGGSRGDCDWPDDALPLVALVPGHTGYTTSARPEVWVYLPFALSEQTLALLTVATPDGTDIAYESAPIMDSAPGFLRLPIESSLAVGEAYNWSFSVFCNDPDMNDVPVSVSGWIQRVEPETIPANQIWYDMLSEAAIVGRQNPRAPEWIELLDFVEGGDALEGQPLLP